LLRLGGAAEGDDLALLSVEDPACCSWRGQVVVMKESFLCCFNRGWKNFLLSMAGEEGAVFSAGRKIFRHCYCVDEDARFLLVKKKLHRESTSVDVANVEEKGVDIAFQSSPCLWKKKLHHWRTRSYITGLWCGGWT
jgi:hypothetical protein